MADDPTGITLAQVAAEESELRFRRFDFDDAWRLGSMLVETARAQHLSIAIDKCCARAVSTNMLPSRHASSKSKRRKRSSDSSAATCASVMPVGSSAISSTYLAEVVS